MEDLQLNISSSKKDKKPIASQKEPSEYKFIKTEATGKIFAKKRPNQSQANNALKFGSKKPKLSKEVNDADPVENKMNKVIKNSKKPNNNLQKPRSGTWMSSLFKNNPDVPRIGQRAVKPLLEKVFSEKFFSDLNIHPHSIANLQQNLGLKELMTVQQNAIPVILQGRDVLIRSQTGSGKTLAYALPIVEGLQEIRPKLNRNAGIKVVIVVPTRELAVQTYELFLKLVKPFTWIVPGLLSGGQKRKAEKARLRKGLSILIGTPGRINDHLRQTQTLNLSKTSCLVLDEADRLLDMGYEKDVAAIVQAINDHKNASSYDPIALLKQGAHKNLTENCEQSKEQNVDNKDSNDEQPLKHKLTSVLLSNERQTILLSATLTKAVENLAGITLSDPVFIDASKNKILVADSLQSKVDESKSKLADDPGGVSEDKIDNMNFSRNDLVKQNSDEKINKIAKSVLQPFKGIKHLGNSESEETSHKDSSKKINYESDSDSDYDYFKAQYNEDRKTKVEEIKEEILPSKLGNTFDDALKMAIDEDSLVLPASVNQTFLVVPMKLRLVTLCSLIVEHCILKKKSGKVIVFMATLEMVDYHADLLETVLTGRDTTSSKTNNKSSKNTKTESSKSYKNDDQDSSSNESEFELGYTQQTDGDLVPLDIEFYRLHGSMPHEDRIKVFKQFRAAKHGVLLCTDVAARGIDVPQVDLVCQYCAPTSATDYVHRVGRTGRAAQVGAAILFLLPSETEFVRYLEEKRVRLRQAEEDSSLEALRTVAPRAGNGQRAASALQARLEHVAHSADGWLASATRAYTSWVRFYAGYPRDVRQWLDAKKLHLGHAAKAFALRDPPAAIARRARTVPHAGDRVRPDNRLSMHERQHDRRPGFKNAKAGAFRGRTLTAASSMHTASEFDSGLPPLTAKRKHADR